ncbi:hypothetical protein C2E23DRAFT_580208 [Lenzites betulinus]|nr:hypothetical protein C2E23DRAFT_580208 [Lenzites betulinus]
MRPLEIRQHASPSPIALPVLCSSQPPPPATLSTTTSCATVLQRERVPRARPCAPPSSPRSLAARPLARARTQLGSREMNASHRCRGPVSDCPLIDYAARGEQTQRPMTLGRAPAALPRRAPIHNIHCSRGPWAWHSRLYLHTHIPATPPRVLRRLGAGSSFAPSVPACTLRSARRGGGGREDAGEGATAGPMRRGARAARSQCGDRGTLPVAPQALSARGGGQHRPRRMRRLYLGQCRHAARGAFQERRRRGCGPRQDHAGCDASCSVCVNEKRISRGRPREYLDIRLRSPRARSFISSG